jgi:hypothetical protein
MARYWVYENWTNRRVRVHRGECGHCKDGHGCQIEDPGRNGKWHGPFNDRSEVFDVAKRLARLDTKSCAVCSP